MVKKPVSPRAKDEAPPPASAQASAAASASGRTAPDRRDAVIDALMRLAAGHQWRAIGLVDIAREAGISLADLRDTYPSKGAILAGFTKRIDRIVLDGTTDDLADEPARERLLDIMMRRFDALAPYKAALRNITRSLRHEPLAIAALNKLAANSQRFMLAAAGISTEGTLGTLKIQGAVAVFARTFETWIDDDEPDLARTLARLDRELRKGERVLLYAQDVHRLTAPLRAFGRALCARRRYGRHRRREDEEPDLRDGDDYVPAL
ncbi:TetR/AcrR family transcriptional regulator [Chelatococcus asaccharovorans]|uniref:TetR family transcriptional regulator n=1 Tax=Chelatococcus asaccharovorans TaxID=28210 RepID=A0A2V3U0T9_9HYPH|nr:TetR/AcrR family transcriptional regulator [Chelatococcus asaccharovorans]MBS7704413.1 TetR/AcrR family transcriptional regulator [Chelatococcus asaccharovorans]PXW55707.1 TetR family transcriptional regulator [Chelatococcus asaccharovorans]